jgi:pullulanase
MSSTFPGDGAYQFSLNTSGGATPTLVIRAQTGDGFADAQVFVRGGFNDWSEDNPMTPVGDGGHEATVTVPAGAAEFKIASGDWATVNCGGPTDIPVGVAAESSTVLSCSETSANLSATFEEGDYKFSVLEKGISSGNPSLIFQPQTSADFSADIFVRGGFNDWSENNPMTNTGGTIYEAVVPVTAGSAEFKIASADWAQVNCGQTVFGNVPTLAPGDTTAISCDDTSGNLLLDVPSDGDLTFTLDAAVPGSPTLTISGP